MFESASVNNLKSEKKWTRSKRRRRKICFFCFTQNTVRLGCWIGLPRTMRFGGAASSCGYFAQGRRAQTGWLMNSVGQISLYVTQ